MRANDQARMQELDRTLGSLSQLSNTIIKYAEQKRDEYQKKEMQRGMALAYTNGVSQTDRDELDEQERQGQALDKETTNLANKVEKDGDPYIQLPTSARCLPGLSMALLYSPCRWVVWRMASHFAQDVLPLK